MKIAVFGVAHMHVHSYLPKFKNLGIDCIGIFDGDRSRLLEFSQQYQLPAFFTIEELLEEAYDLAIICSENIFHKEYALMNLAKHKHVLVEKPMALTSKDAEEMNKMAEKQGVSLMVAHPVRFSTPIQELREYLKSHDLGTLRSINGTNHGKNPGSWFVDPELSGGGALVDHTVHVMDLVNFLFGLQPESVAAYRQKSDPEMAVEDIGLLSMTFKEEVILSLDTSWNRPDIYPVWGDATLELLFDHGYILVDGFGRKLKLFSDKTSLIEDYYYDEDMDQRMIEALVSSLEEGTIPAITGEDGLYTVQITEMAYQSAMTGKECLFE